MSSVFPLMTELAEGTIGVKRLQAKCGKMKKDKAAKVKRDNIIRRIKINLKSVCGRKVLWRCRILNFFFFFFSKYKIIQYSTPIIQFAFARSATEAQKE